VDFADEVPFTIASQFVRPGSWDLRALEQDQVWVDIHAVVHRLDDMSWEYQRNVVALLRDNAADIQHKCMAANLIECLYAAMTGQAGPEPLDLSLDPVTWIENTVLVRRLRELMGVNSDTHVAR